MLNYWMLCKQMLMFLLPCRIYDAGLNAKWIYRALDIQTKRFLNAKN